MGTTSIALPLSGRRSSGCARTRSSAWKPTRLNRCRSGAGVVAFGRYTELPRTPDGDKERHHAHTLLWPDEELWEPGYARTITHAKTHALEPVHFRIDLGEVTGRRAAPSG